MIPEGREISEVHSIIVSAYCIKAGFRSHVGGRKQGPGLTG